MKRLPYSHTHKITFSYIGSNENFIRSLACFWGKKVEKEMTGLGKEK